MIYKLYEYTESIVWNPKQYQDNEQKLFFRISNIEFFAKMSMRYQKYRCSSISEFSNKFCQKMFDESKRDYDFITLICQFITTLYKAMNKSNKKSSKTIWMSSQWFKEINECVEKEIYPFKIQFKWMDIVEMLE